MKPRTLSTGERMPLPDAPAADAPAFAATLQPVPVRVRHDGWTAERQRIFLTVLSETGSISEACQHAGVSSRSAYRLRARGDAVAFARAWDDALRLATARLTAVAFERATVGKVREIWKDGELRGHTREPSDRILIFLLQHLLPAGKAGERWGGFEEMATASRAAFPATLAALADHPCEMVPIESRDFFPACPGDQREDV
jgi:hypothetical protein